MNPKLCDLVIEGGGVKGLALLGALQVLQRQGYDFRRIAGTSAGAIVGALIAAKVPMRKLLELMVALDYRQFRDEGTIDQFSIPGKTVSLVFEKGIYEGKFMRDWLARQLAEVGVRTFADLKITEPWAKKLPPEQRYRLVVIVSDISRGQLIRLPWDYKKYNVDPDKQLVADAVRASASIPFFFEPAKLAGSYLVDGALLSNFPITLFDDDTPDCETLGIKLSAKPETVVTNKVGNIVDYIRAVVDTAMTGHDQMHLDDPCTQMRTMFVDTTPFTTTDFDISREDQQKLYRRGQRAARKFLSEWDYEKYKKICTSLSPSQMRK